MQLPNHRYRQRENRYICHDVGQRVADKKCVVVNTTFGGLIGITIPETGDRFALENGHQYLRAHVTHKNDSIRGKGLVTTAIPQAVTRPARI